MPTYVYRREDGSTFELQQRITEDALEVCPDTGQKVERVITGAGLIFKGSGFYLTDYARKREADSSKSDSSQAKESKETKESGASTEAPTASKETTKSEKSEKASSSNGKAAPSSNSSE